MVGPQLLRQFFVDILGLTTTEAKVFMNKTHKFFGSTRVVSWEMKVMALIGVILFNLFSLQQCVLYGSIKGNQWQWNWITLSLVTSFFLFPIELTYEAIMIGYVIPSQIIDSVRAAQATLHTALLKLVSSRDNSDSNTNTFSASTYIFPSVYLAEKFRNLPESDFILSFVDPLPHINLENNNTTLIRSHRSRTWLSWWRTLSLLPIVLYIGTLPTLLQRCVINLPVPFICGAIVGLMIAFLQFPEWITIPISVIMVILFVFGLYYVSLFMYNWSERIKKSHAQEAEDRIKLQSDLDALSADLAEQENAADIDDGFEDEVEESPRRLERRFTTPKIQVDAIESILDDNDKIKKTQRRKSAVFAYDDTEENIETQIKLKQSQRRAERRASKDWEFYASSEENDNLEETDIIEETNNIVVSDDDLDENDVKVVVKRKKKKMRRIKSRKFNKNKKIFQKKLTSNLVKNTTIDFDENEMSNVMKEFAQISSSDLNTDKASPTIVARKVKKSKTLKRSKTKGDASTSSMYPVTNDLMDDSDNDEPVIRRRKKVRKKKSSNKNIPQNISDSDADNKGDKNKTNKIKIKLNENILSSIVPTSSVQGSSDTTSGARLKKKSTKKKNCKA